MTSSKFEIVLKARRAVHLKHSYPIIIYPKSGGEPVAASARVHYEFTYLGDQLGTNFNYVEISDYSELKFVFWREDVPSVEYGDRVTLPWGKTYILDVEQVEDKFTYKVRGTLVPPNEEGLLAYPNG